MDRESEYIVLPLTKETHEFITTFTNIGIDKHTLHSVIFNYLYPYTYHDEEYANAKYLDIGIDNTMDKEYRKELFNEMFFSKKKPLHVDIYYQVFNWYLDSLLRVWKFHFYLPESIDIPILQGDEIIIEKYYSQYAFHEIHQGTDIIVKRLY